MFVDMFKNGEFLGSPIGYWVIYIFYCCNNNHLFFIKYLVVSNRFRTFVLLKQQQLVLKNSEK
jgi:hypothetical protein